MQNVTNARYGNRALTLESTAQTGWTLIELLVVITLIAILSSMAISKFNSSRSFEEWGFSDKTLSALNYAHKLSTSGGCDTRVQMTASNLTISQWSSCKPSSHSGTTTPVTNPQGRGDFELTKPTGFTTGTLDIYFDSLGRPHDTSTTNPIDAAISLSIGNRTLIIEPETGYVH